MNKQGPSMAELKKRLKRGTRVRLPDGQQGVFLEFGKHDKTMARVLVGGLDGPKRTDSVQGIIKATWGAA